MTDFRMPILGADMTSGTVVEYLVDPGEAVTKGQPVAVIDTEKAAIEVESPVDGIWDSVAVPVGQNVPVGAVLATITATSAKTSLPMPAEHLPAEPPAQQPAASSKPTPQRHEGFNPAKEPPVTSPLVRHLAHTKGIDLRQVTPTGPRGAVTRQDIGRAAAARRPRSSPYARRLAAALHIDPRDNTATGRGGGIRAADVTACVTADEPGMRPSAPGTEGPRTSVKGAATQGAAARRQAAVAALMARSKREIPHFYLATTADCGPLLEEIGERNAGRAVADRLLPAAGLLRAVVKATLEVPALNGHWVDGKARRGVEIDLGIAISLRDGSLIAPAMRSSQHDSMERIMLRLKALVSRARQGRLSGDDAGDPSITVTNLGDLGVEVVYPIIYPPQLAMVGIGRISNRPWAVGDALAVRPVVTISLAVDHRAVNGHQAGLFLAAIERALAAPAEL